MLDFIELLRSSWLPLARLRLVRNAEAKSRPGLTPFDLWNRELAQFDEYQSRQSDHAHTRLQNADFWVSFVAIGNKTLFVGIYRAEYLGRSTDVTFVPTTGTEIAAGDRHVYRLELTDTLAEYAGRLFINWGAGTRTFVQRATSPRPITELLDSVKVLPFPGLLNLITPLSAVPGFPDTWKAVLRSARGVYLLVCARTREQYVGSASGESGFYSRWMQYVQTGHGDNIKLKSREPSDYQVSILQLAGDTDNIVEIEERWKQKLRSRDMGLNAN
jgi:hypothetical protein